MNNAIGIAQVQNVSQRLNLAPQLLKWLQLLQVPAIELNQIVQHELETNPVLELDPNHQPEATVSLPEEAAFQIDQGSNDDPVPATFDQADLAKRLEALHTIDNDWEESSASGANAASSGNKEIQDWHQHIMDSIVAPESLFEHLIRQLAVLHIDDQDRRLAEYIIGSLDQRGYLDASIQDIAANGNTTLEHVEKVLAIIHQMDPPGIAAHDLRECLCLQINRQQDPLAFAIVHDCFDQLSRRDVAGIAETLHCDQEAVHEALASISRLNPTPGLDIQRQAAEYVTPDVIVHRENGQCVVTITNDFVPALRLSDEYEKMLSGATKMAQADISYLRHKMRSATFLIQGIAQRQQTLYKVASEIVRVQREFFESKDSEIGALTMGKVARVIGVHETTVSRAVFGKYMKTPRGIFPMKAFFEAGYSCTDGSVLTSKQVKDVIADIVDNEAPGKHVTDIDISRIMEKRGLKIARRTVAKYRKELCLPSSKERMGFMTRGRPDAIAPDDAVTAVAATA